MTQTWLGIDAAVAVAGVMLLALMAYAVFAGADFGGGVWDLFASGPRRDEQRLAIAKAIGPVWEANHVWLIFIIVILFSALPEAYRALSIVLFTPFHLVLVGIVLRGAAFVFRVHADVASLHWRTWAWVFGASSTITPILLGATAGAVSSGGIRVVDGQVSVDPLQAWFGPVSLLIGFLTLAVCAYLAAVFLTMETDGALREDFRQRALVAGGATAVLAAVLLPLIALQSPLLWEHLSLPQSVPFLAGGTLLAVLSFWAVWGRRYRAGRALAVAQVVILVGGFAMAQWPYVIYPDVTFYGALAPGPSVRFLLNSLPFGFALLIPSLLFLFAVFKREERY